ncbi:MAG: VPLPA-CTERM sorting domain-containing protein [Pseudomonadota bacterium]
MKTKFLLAILAGAFAALSAAKAEIILFAGNGGDLGKQESFTSGSITATAIAINTEEPAAPTLHQHLLGLGVKSGWHDSSQIDNGGDDEAIVIDFGRSVNFHSILLSASFIDDDIRIYGTNDHSVAAVTSGGLSSITSISTLIAQTSGNLSTFVSLNIAGNAFQYLIATVPGTNGWFADDFRVKKVKVSEVPVPAALPLMIAGLAGLRLASRRKRGPSV